jgi:NO-binding membrane sensor protein with MHYT domain
MFYYHKRDFVSYDFGIKYLSIFASILTCFLSFYIFFNVALLKNPYYLLLGTWINSGTLYVE